MVAPSPHSQLWRWEIQKYFDVGPITTGQITTSGHILPSVTNTYDLGSATLRWRTIYTSDLSLNNGVGDWTIVEGEDDLFLYNNRKSTVYKIALIEIDPALATPKRNHDVD